MYVFNRQKIVFLSLAIVLSVFFYAQSTSKKDTLSASSTPISNHTVILDAGHGNPDGGAVGADGSIESELNLDLVLKLQKFLEASNCTVILTRSDEKRNL